MHTDTQAGFATLSEARPLVFTVCALCGADDPEPVAVGADFRAARASDETFLMVRCRACGLLYLNPRPSVTSPRGDAPHPIGSLRRWAAARRFNRWCRDLPAHARILHVAAATELRFAPLYAVARARGYTIDRASARAPGSDAADYDLIVLLESIECVAEPAALLATLRAALRPGGRLIVTTKNAHSLGFRLFRARYWGGYDFPRHPSVFTQATLARLADRSGLRIVKIATSADPATWANSLRNVLLDMRAPDWLVARFRADARATFVLFATLDAIASRAGRGGILRATFERSAS